MPSYLTFFLSVATLCFLPSCSEEEDAYQSYIFLGHAYDWLSENKLDPRLELLDYESFDGIWLGGDICARSSKETATLTYLDSLVGLSKSSTLWAIGNHDILEGDLNRITEKTKRPSYYGYQQNGLSILVINTNLFWHNAWDPPRENCEEKIKQMDFIKAFCDTVSSTKQLVVLHHHGLFNEMKLDQNGQVMTTDNINAIPIRPLCAPESNLTADWYPYLKKVHDRGIEVYCIGGDVGMTSKGYYFQTQEGIHLLGSGINNSMNMENPAPYVKNFNPDTVLIIKHWSDADSLSWDFIRLNDLVSDHRPNLDKQFIGNRVQFLLDKY